MSDRDRIAPGQDTHRCQPTPQCADAKNKHRCEQDLGATKNVAEFSEQGLGDGEAQEVCGREPVLVCKIAEVGTYDVHGGGGGGLVEVGGKIAEPQAGHDQEESKTGDDDGGLSDVWLGTLGGLCRGRGWRSRGTRDGGLVLVEYLYAVVHGRALRQGVGRGGTHER